MPDGSFFASRTDEQNPRSSIVALSAKLAGINGELLRIAAEIQQCQEEGRSGDHPDMAELLRRRRELEESRESLMLDIEDAAATTAFEAALKAQCVLLGCEPLELAGNDLTGLRSLVNDLFAMSSNG